MQPSVAWNTDVFQATEGCIGFIRAQTCSGLLRVMAYVSGRCCHGEMRGNAAIQGLPRLYWRPCIATPLGRLTMTVGGRA